MKILSKGEECYFKLEEKTSGSLFAKGPIKTPSSAFEAVSDSSRYFVVRVEDDNGKLNLIKILILLIVLTQ